MLLEKIGGGRESPTLPSAAERRESACGESRSVPESAEWLRKEPRGVAGCLSEKAGWGGKRWFVLWPFSEP